MLPRLKVEPAGRHLLLTEEGHFFFLLGDTAWELVHRLNRDQIEHYLTTRNRQKFNFTMVNALAEMDGLRVPNTNGDVPFTDLDPTRPNEAYFQHLDFAIDRAAELGIYVGLLPAWGDKITAPWGVGPAIFSLENLEVVRAYAAWIAGRYKDRTNVVWVLGGDRPAAILPSPQGEDTNTVARENALEEGIDWTPIWRTFAHEILEATEGAALITYHPQGGYASSSQFLHTATWLSFNMMQSGHGGGHDVPVWNWIHRDRDFAPAKPTLDAEPNYEDHPVNPWPVWNEANGYFRDYDVRKQMYRAIFAGACGAVYGHHSVWQFYDERYEPINHAECMWTEALTRPGAEQVGFLRELMESRRPMTRIPDQHLIVEVPTEPAAHPRAMRCINGTHAYVYFPLAGQRLSIDLTMFKGAAEAYWFNPRSGETTEVGHVESDKPYEFTSPANELDMVLILENHN